MIDINRATFYFVAKVGYLDCKFYGILSELVLIICHLIKVLSFCRYTAPTVRRYVATQLDIWSRCDHSIYFSLCSKFDMLPLATSVDCAAVVTYLALPVGQRISSALAPYRVADISSDASAAHIDVEPTCETHDGLDMGQDSKRYKNRSKTGVETPKGIFLTFPKGFPYMSMPLQWSISC